MKKHGCFRQSVIFCITLFCFCGNVFAQLKADFTANNLSGCSPIIVSFTDQSAGNPTQWRWDLGNGVISVLRNPSTTFFNPGTYNIKLVVRNASGSDSVTKNKFITVYPGPAVSFSASDTTGCFPLHVIFSDPSTAGSGTITNYNWDFGDGSVSTIATPSHVYTSAGNYTVTLRIANSFGCVKTYSKTNYIKISSGVKAKFTNTNAGQCSSPVTIHFTNTTSGPGSLQYAWDFGDGTFSPAQSPIHIYSNPGTYTVSLIAVSPQGCSDTIIKKNLISIGSIKSGFIIPGNICVGAALTITNTTTPSPGSVLWSFGDGTSSTQVDPVKIYNTSGTYTIKLVNNFGGCIDSISKQIIVSQKPVAAFTAGTTTSCKVPFTASFSDQSVGASNWQWDFGDGSVSGAQNPIHIYTATGKYSVALIAMNASGCSDTVKKLQYIQIEKPSITINGLPQTGCAPININPTATIVANQPIISYLWNFGDGATSSLINPTHTYNLSGNYDVSLITSTASGCTDTVIIKNAVRAGIKPNTLFTANPTNICAFQPVHFSDNSTGTVDQWFWQFGDGGTSTVQNPLHAYEDTGYFSVMLIDWNNTCPDTLVIKNAVYIMPPISRFHVNNNCSNKYKKDFIDQSVGANSWLWNFGDGTTSSSQNPSHTYLTSGNFDVSLTVSNATCTHTSQQTIKVVNEKANFIADNTTICRNAAINFSAIQVNVANISGWQWNFGDGTMSSTISTASHVYMAVGIYPVSLIITDILGCVDSVKSNITVHGPSAFFTASVPSACLGNSNILFSDASSTDGIHPIVKRVWSFGDGIIDSISLAPYSHIYTVAGNYDVLLTVTDSYGCSDIYTSPSPIIIAHPIAAFSSPDTNSCIGKPISFLNASSGIGLQYSWKFGDGIQNVTANPVHQYPAVGVYTVALNIMDQYGCKDSVSMDKYINITMPHAIFSISDSFSTCPPLLVNFINTSSNYISLNWDFGDGNTSILDNPSHYYTTPGIFFAILTVTGPGGCTDVSSKRIEVRGPQGSFTYTPLIGCNPSTVAFTASTVNRISFIWDFSDGTTVATTDSVITHIYNSPGDYVPKMILIDGSGCNLPIVGLDIIKVVDIDASFQLDAFRFCDSGFVNFTNTTVSNDLISNFTWDFGDGSTSNDPQPIHHYILPGTYSVQLSATTQNGCTKSVLLVDTINVFVSPMILIKGDTSACIPATLTFSGDVSRGNPGSLQWLWNFGNGQRDSVQNPVSQTYLAAINYTVRSMVTDDHGCSDNQSRTVIVHPLPLTNAGNDLILCKGNSQQLRADGASTYSWFPFTALSCSNCSNPIASPANTIQYVVTGTSDFGCKKTDTLEIIVRKPFILTISPGDSLCVGEIAHLSASGADQYKWTPSIGLDNPDQATTNAVPRITTLYKLTAKDKDNCFVDTATVLIVVTPLPTVEAGKDITVSAGASDQLHASGSIDITSWSWSPQYQLNCFTCPDPSVTPKQTTTYSIKVKNAAGCTSKDALTVFVTCNNGNLFIPNTFSPNGDGMNDRFYPRGTGIGLIKSFRVFNRWGEIVFEKINFNANDASAGWDGTYKGQRLTPDVFIYTCEVICINNEILLFKGDVTLIQ